MVGWMVGLIFVRRIMESVPIPGPSYKLCLSLPYRPSSPSPPPPSPPARLTVSTGRYLTGALVGCLRRMQHWNMSSILNEVGEGVRFMGGCVRMV